MAKARKQTESSSVIDQPVQSPDHQTPERSGGDGADHRDRIAMRAYELYLARGGGDGADFDDWLAAEREIAAGDGSAPRFDEGE